MRKEIFCILISATAIAGGTTFKGISMQSKMSYHCVAQWKMNDDAADTTVEDSIGSYDGTASKNTEDMNAVGKINGALDFNGVNDYVNTNDTLESIFQDNFSISFWCKPTDGQPALVLDILGTGSVFEDSCCIDSAHYTTAGNGLIFFAYRVSDTSVTTISPVSVFSNGQETWHHIVWVVKQISPTTVGGFLYFDGSLIKTANAEMVMSNYVNSSNFLLGIAKLDVGDNFFNGALDNVTIHNRALNQVEIDWLYNDGNGREL